MSPDGCVEKKFEKFTNQDGSDAGHTILSATPWLYRGEMMFCLRELPDGMIISGSGKYLKLWDPMTKMCYRIINNCDSVIDIKMLDDKTMISLECDKLSIW